MIISYKSIHLGTDAVRVTDERECSTCLTYPGAGGRL